MELFAARQSAGRILLVKEHNHLVVWPLPRPTACLLLAAAEIQRLFDSGVGAGCLLKPPCQKWAARSETYDYKERSGPLRTTVSNLKVTDT